MPPRLSLIALATLAAFALPSARPAAAHPHVWVTMQSEVVFDAQGAVSGVRHAWQFDDMFSAYAVQGMTAKTAGKFTREELSALAEVNISSLKDYDYFNYATADGQKVAFGEPTDYFLEHRDGALVLNFLLPVKAPAKTKQFSIEVFDPSIFVDFSFAKEGAGKEAGSAKPVALANAPAACKFALTGPTPPSAADQRRLSQLDRTDQVPPDLLALGKQFANTITVTCP